MVVISIARPDGTVVRGAFDKNELTIGRAAGNDVVLTDAALGERHAKVVAVWDGGCSLRTRGGAPLHVRAGDAVPFGGHKLVFEELYVTPIPPIEKRFLREMRDASARDDTRLVYADWLDENGASDRAEFLRLQHELRALSPDAPSLAPKSARLRELADAIDVRWRKIVAHLKVENCGIEFDFKCPKDWASLEAASGNDDVRFCGSCCKNVYYCSTTNDVKLRALRGECVAIDPAVLRAKGDLLGPDMRMCPRCDAASKDDGSSFCTACGAALESRIPMLAGMIVPPSSS